MNTINWLFAKIVWLFVLAIGTLGALALLGAAAALHSMDSLPMGLAFLGGVLLSVVQLLDWSAHRHAKAAADPAASFVLSYSTISLALMSCAFLAFAIACGLPLAAGLESSSARGWAWIGLTVFAATAVGAPIQRLLFSLTISPSGLDYSAFKTGPIPWQDIDSVSVSRRFRTEAVILQLRDEDKYRQRGSSVSKRWLGWPIPETSFDVSAEWLAKAIQLRLDCFGTASKPFSPTVQRQGTPV